jgi:hypothetical protein
MELGRDRVPKQYYHLNSCEHNDESGSEEIHLLSVSCACTKYMPAVFFVEIPVAP